MAVCGSPPGRVLLPLDLLPLHQELPAALVRVGSVVVIPAVSVMEDEPVGDDGGGLWEEVISRKWQVSHSPPPHPCRSQRISTTCASTTSLICTLPRDAPTPPGAFGATSLVTARRTERSRGFFDGGCPDTCLSLLNREGMVCRRPHLRLHFRRIGLPSYRPHLRFVGTRRGGIPPFRRLRRVRTLTRRRPHRVGLLPHLSPTTSSRGTQQVRRGATWSRPR
jgi:hypothetical protein